MRKLAIAFVLLLTASTSRADDSGSCGTLDLDGPRGPLHDTPIFDQPGDTCFAHSAVELAEGWRRSHPQIPAPPAAVPEPQPGGSRFVCSPVALLDAIGHKPGKTVIDAHISVQDSLALLRAKGACNHNALFGNGEAGITSDKETQLLGDLREEYEFQSRWYNEHKPWLLATVEELQARHPDWDMMHTNLEAFYEGALKSHAAADLCVGLTNLLGDAYFPKPFTKASLTKMLAAMLASNKSLDAFIDDYFKKVCDANHIALQIPEPKSFPVVPDNRAVVDKLKTITWGAKTDSGARSFIDERLSRPNPQPIGLDICAGVLTDKDSFKRGAYEAGWGCVDKQEHAVVVIGRQWDAARKKCTYKLRNSWGPGCYRYGETGWKCDDRGQLWVDSDKLLANTYQVNYLGD